CIYCVVAHGAVLRIREKNPLLADQLATNYRKADLSDRQRTMLDFAVKVSQSAYEISEGDFELLKNQGFSDDEIWDIGAIAGLFALSNRLANMAGIRPNDEFYLMGRSNIEPIQN
ncbi:MAG: peroxidase-related enzyme, partial [Gammaproteobacteria bacterium]|nr:peroxidase-related enzyme [Gammaproteobacteria bacterium]